MLVEVQPPEGDVVVGIPGKTVLVGVAYGPDADVAIHYFGQRKIPILAL